MAKAKGHLDEEMTNLQLTQQKKLGDDTFLLQDSLNIKYDTTFFTIEKATSYSNLTRRFPHQSAQGNNYIVITYNYDSNSILVKRDS